jgi:D-threo-aldose 1-dehydrogenase
MVGCCSAALLNSGILATGATPAAKYNYKPAPTEIVGRVTRIDAVCQQYEVPLAAAAIQFPLGHPNVASIIPGAVNVAEVERSTDYIKLPIPRALWDELKAQNLLAADAPVPMPAD